MFKWIKRLLTKLLPEPDSPDTWRDLEDHDKFAWIIKKGCLVCLENPDFEVTMGPSAGMSQNVWCTKCGTRWNMTVFSSTQGVAELIEERDPKKVLREAVETIENERKTNGNPL